MQEKEARAAAEQVVGAVAKDAGGDSSDGYGRRHQGWPVQCRQGERTCAIVLWPKARSALVAAGSRIIYVSRCLPMFASWEKTLRTHFLDRKSDRKKGAS